MTFIPFAVTSDDRRDKALAPIRLVNVYLEEVQDGAPKPAQYVLRPWPGLVKRYAGPTFCRGIFAQDGVLGGTLFAVFGTTLYSISSTYTATAIGTISGGDVVRWGALRSKLLIQANGLMWQWDGSSFAQVVDGDFPPNVFDLETIDQRAVVSVKDSDTYYWSAVLDATSYAALAFATSERKPDKIIALGVLGGDLWVFGASSIEPLRGGGDANLPFQAIRSVDINMGCAARDSVVLIDSSFFFVNDDLVVCRTEGYSPVRLPNRDLEDALKALTDPTNLQGFRVSFGSKIFYVLRLSTGEAWAYDIAFGTWLFLSTWQASAYKVSFCVTAYQKTFCAGVDTPNLFSYEDATYTDDGATIERVATFSVPFSQRQIVKSLAFDMTTHAQPLSGQGSDPVMLFRYWKDSGRYLSGSAYVERQCKLGARGATNYKPNLRRMGLVNPQDGFIGECRITDPVGFNLFGVRVNEPLP